MRNSPIRKLLSALRRDKSAISVVEFALGLPFLMFTACGGMEIAYMGVVHLRVNQIAISLADNASRMKQETVGGAPKIREFDVNQALTAAEKQGSDLRLAQHGRMILSSLETNASDGQWIHWQRCAGSKTKYTSSYGLQGAGATGTDFDGMGPMGNKVTSEDDAAVMVAEVVYEYQPLIFGAMAKDLVIRKYSAMYVRDDRDLTGAGVWNQTPTVTVSSCA